MSRILPEAGTRGAAKVHCKERGPVVDGKTVAIVALVAFIFGMLAVMGGRNNVPAQTVVVAVPTDTTGGGGGAVLAAICVIGFLAFLFLTKGCGMVG